MIEMLEREIIPQLLKLHPVSPEHQKQMEENPQIPLFTLVFDREAWSPDFFVRLWNTHRIAVITYRKNVTDKWDESLFSNYTVKTYIEEEEMKLHIQNVVEAGFTMREVRKLQSDGHQVSIVTTHPLLTIEAIAGNLFARRLLSLPKYGIRKIGCVICVRIIQ